MYTRTNNLQLGVQVPRGGKRRCGACNNGWVTVEERLPCGSCGGSGKQGNYKCNPCNGTGIYSRIVRRFCKVCGGKGYK